MPARCRREPIRSSRRSSPSRRCNLDCAYCNEYDKVSDPVPLDAMLRRIDKLADLGCSIITLSGGEPTLHPDLDAIIARIRQRGAIATLITNGLLAHSGADPGTKSRRDSIIFKSASITYSPTRHRRKVCVCSTANWSGLPKDAEFGVTINSVLGCGIREPEDAYTIGNARVLSAFIPR